MIGHAPADLWIVPLGTKCFEDPRRPCRHAAARGTEPDGRSRRAQRRLAPRSPGQQQRVPHRHAAGLFDELDKLLETQSFLISGARATSRRETVRRDVGRHRFYLLGARGKRGTENDRRRKRKSGKEAGASRGQGGLLILALKQSISRVSLSEGSLRLTKTLPPRLRTDREGAKSRGLFRCRRIILHRHAGRRT